MPNVYIGLSGFSYPDWRGRFYPASLPASQWLAFASHAVRSIELNATFYRLQSPHAFRSWRAAVPRTDFVFAVKGSRFITHNLKLAHPRDALANFFASGVLELGHALGPFLWQLPRTLSFDRARVDAFLSALPRTTAAAERLARGCDRTMMHDRVTLRAPVRRRLRHALEVRHPSFFCEACYALLRRHGCALVASHGAGAFPMVLETTARFAYVRLHGARSLYAGSYGDAALAEWARRIRAWRRGGLDVYVYFDNDMDAAAPRDALRLARLVRR